MSDEDSMNLSMAEQQADRRFKERQAEISQNGMNREEHLEWAKKRALEYIEHNDWMQAWTSTVSDLRKHPDLENHRGIELGMMLIMIPDSNYRNCAEMRRFIEGFN